MPHERDEATTQKGHPAEPVIEQALEDVDRGLVDTEERSRAAEVFKRRWVNRKS